MKNTLLFFIALGLISACAVSQDLGMNIVLPTCDKLRIPDNCSNPQGNANAPVINFNKNSLNLSPRNVCAAPNSTIEFKITPASGNKNPPGSVAVIAKNGADTWLIGTNSFDSKEIKIKIPGGVPVNTPHEYTIVSIIDGVISCVDPRVHVQN